MTPVQRFCEECGRPLSPGIKFCEECGAPVQATGTPVTPTPASPATSTPASPATPALATPAPPVSAQSPLAVVPFAYRHRGVFSIERLTLVVYPDRLVLATVPKAREEAFDQAMMEVQAELARRHLEGKTFWQLAARTGIVLFKVAWSPVNFYTEDAVTEGRMLRTIAVPTRPWEWYLSMTADAVLAEDARNRAIQRESVGYCRGESDPTTNTDQVIIQAADGPVTLFLEFGIYSLARDVLNTFVFPAPAGRETIVGVIPYAEEPGVPGFGFEYTWIVVVTDQRLIFCMVEDDFADEAGEWVEARLKEGKQARQVLPEGALAGRPDAPWQQFMHQTPASLLVNEVNFFIPLSSIRSADLVAGGPGQADELCINLPGEPYDITFPSGTAGHIRAVLGPALGVRLREAGPGDR